MGNIAVIQPDNLSDSSTAKAAGDHAAARANFELAIERHGVPEKISFCRDSAKRPGITARPTTVRKPASRTDWLLTRLGL